MARTAMSDAEKRSRALRFRALRKALKLTGDQVAELAGVDRTVVSKVETRANAVTTADIQGKLAPAFGLSPSDFAAYLSDRLTLDEALSRRATVSISVARDILEQVTAHPLRWHAGTLLQAARDAVQPGPGEAQSCLTAIEVGLASRAPIDQQRQIVTEGTRALSRSRR